MRKKILLIEDDNTTRSVLTKILEHAGHQVIPHASAEEAEHILRDCDSYDVAIVDVRLPGEWGDSFAKKLNFTCAIPIVFVTGEFDAERLRESLPNALVFRKPLSIPPLLDRISTLS